MKVLMIDLGGTTAKVFCSGEEGFKKVSSGRGFTPAKLVKQVKEAVEGWEYEAVTLAFPGTVKGQKITRVPKGFGSGWGEYDFEKSFKAPVQVINEAALRALATYETGRVLVLSLGTTVGAAIAADGVILPIEIAMMPISKSEAFMDRLNKEALEALGRKRWRRAVERAVHLLRDIFVPDRIRICGANAKHLEKIPEGCETDEHDTYFRGATRMWPGGDVLASAGDSTWRIKRKAD